MNASEHNQVKAETRACVLDEAVQSVVCEVENALLYLAREMGVCLVPEGERGPVRPLMYDLSLLLATLPDELRLWRRRMIDHMNEIRQEIIVPGAQSKTTCAGAGGNAGKPFYDDPSLKIR